MIKAPSMKRLAVADRYTKRVLYLEKKGIDTNLIKSELKKVPGISITAKGRISINKEIYSEAQAKNDILDALEAWVPKSTQYKGSKPDIKSTKIKKSKELAKKLTERADEISERFGFDKKEFLKRAESVEGITVSDEGIIDIDPQYYSEEQEQAAYKEVYSADEMVEEVKNALVEEGLSEGDLENLSEEDIKKKAVGIYMWKDERSVFKKYYDYIDKDTHLPKNNDHFKEHAADYQKAQKSMSDLGRILSKEGFKSTSYQDKRAEIETILGNLK